MLAGDEAGGKPGTKLAYTRNQRFNLCELGKGHGRKPGFQTGPGKIPRKARRWWKWATTSQPKGRGIGTLHLPVGAPEFYPSGTQRDTSDTSQGEAYGLPREICVGRINRRDIDIKEKIGAVRVRTEPAIYVNPSYPEREVGAYQGLVEGIQELQPTY
jgi:hypothetical protein